MNMAQYLFVCLVIITYRH